MPNGGYVASVLLTVVKTHFRGTLAHLDQPDSMSAQLQYLRRTRHGPGVVTVEHLKLGSSTSTVQVILSQDDRSEVQGYIVQTNFAKQSGLSRPTSWVGSAMAPRPPPIDFSRVEQTGEDANWLLDHGLANTTKTSFRRITRNLLFYRQKHEPDPSISDQWIRLRPGGSGNPVAPLPQEAVGLVVDIFPQMALFFSGLEGRGTHWYPTVALNFEVKRNLPPGGADWLFTRARAGEVRNGRFDLQVIVLDQDGNLVAISTHISLVLSSERNIVRNTQGSNGTAGGTSGKL